jgi:ribose transport system substrate-binding protein
MKAKKSLLVLIALILVASLSIGLVGCSSGQQKTADSNQQTPADSENTDQAKDNDDITIGFILMSRSTEFLVAEEWGAVEEAKRQGVELIVIDGENSSERQVASAEDLIARGVDALILNPYNSGGIVAAVEKANEAGIPVITVDSIAAGGNVDVHVGFDNVEGGRMAAEYLAETLGVKGTVLEIHGPLGAFHAENRHKGFIEVMDKYSDIDVITIEAPEWVSGICTNIWKH